MDRQEEIKEISNINDPLTEIDLNITKLEARLRSVKKSKAIYSVFVLIILAAITFIFLGPIILQKSGYSTIANKAPLIGLIVIGYVLFGGGYFYILRSAQISSIERDLDMLKAKREIILRGLNFEIYKENSDKNSTYFDRLVDINITNLEAYYRLVKDHTNNSFIASISAGTIGFLLIVSGLIIGFLVAEKSRYLAYISSGSGILVEFIAGVFFYLYNKTVRQLKEYHDSLIEVQNVLLSFKIVGDTENADKQATLMELLLKYLLKEHRTIQQAQRIRLDCERERKRVNHNLNRLLDKPG